jgi:hypothetical protein
VVKDFGINLKENLSVKDVDVNFNDEIDENLVLIKDMQEAE